MNNKSREVIGMDGSRTGNAISRVKCVVDTCTYWKQGNHCHAEAIEIQPRNARSVQDTDCGTFMNRATGQR